MASTYHLVKLLKNDSSSLLTSHKRKELFSLSQVTQNCRICLQKGHFPIFSQYKYFDVVPLKEHLKVICDIDVTVNDQYPQCLCKSCFNTLKAAIKLRNAAKNTQLKLKRMQHSVKKTKIAEITQSTVDGQSLLVVSALNLSKTPEKAVLKSEKTTSSEYNASDADSDIESYLDIVKNLELYEKKCKSKLKKTFSTSESGPESEKISKKEQHAEIEMEYLEIAKSLQTAQHQKRHKPKIKEISTSDELEHSEGDDDEWKNYCDMSREYPKLVKEDRDLLNRNKYFKKLISMDKKPVYECQICKKIFKRTSKDHIIEHLPDYEPQHTCEVCGKTFKKYINFYQHQYLHAELKFKCSKCPYKGRNKDQLRNHSKIHGQECKYLCTHCPRKFLNSSNLKRHLRRHAEPTFKCTICHKSFYDNFILKKHINSQHSDSTELHKCNICGNNYRSRKYLLTHEIRVHKRKKRSKNRAEYLKEENEQETTATNTLNANEESN